MTIHELEPWQIRFCEQNGLTPEEYLDELEKLATRRAVLTKKYLEAKHQYQLAAEVLHAVGKNLPAALRVNAESERCHGLRTKGKRCTRRTYRGQKYCSLHGGSSRDIEREALRHFVVKKMNELFGAEVEMTPAGIMLRACMG
jgi:hypothetical protein